MTIIDERDAIERRNAANLDEHGHLRDGGSYRVPLFMADSAPIDRRIADAYERGLADARKKTTVRDPRGRLKETWETEEEETDDAFTDSRGVTYTDHRITETQRVLDRMAGQQAAFQQIARDGRAAAEQARAAMIADQVNAWRNDPTPTGAGSHETFGVREGDACMTDDTHEPGVYVREGNNVVCRAHSVPQPADARQTFDRATSERIKQQAWEQMVRDQSEAWKGER